MYVAMWIIVMVVMILIELSVYQIVSIWFALGAIGAIITAFCGGSLKIQVAVFFIVSLALLLCTRPAVEKLTHFKNTHILKSNEDEI